MNDTDSASKKESPKTEKRSAANHHFEGSSWSCTVCCKSMRLSYHLRFGVKIVGPTYRSSIHSMPAIARS